MTAGAAYRAACAQRKVKKVNRSLCQQLDDKQLGSLEGVDLSSTYLGNRGLMALLDVVEQAPQFRAIDISGQKIYNTDPLPGSLKGNELLDRLLELARTHPALSSIDLSGNPLSNLAARRLLALANDNARITCIRLENTRIDQELLERIDQKTQANNSAAGDSGSPFRFGEVQAPEDGDGGFGSAVMPAQTGGLKVGGVSRRKTVSAPSYDAEAAKQFKPPVYPKDAGDKAMIASLLRDNLLFSHLDSSNISVCIDAMQHKFFNKGDEPLQEGDEGDKLFVIAQGQCDILKKGVKVAEKPEKSAFGELELMYDTPCVATVRVTSDRLDVWVLDRETYKHIVVGASIRKRQQYESLLATVPFMQDLAEYERMQIADALSSDEWAPGVNIITYDDEGQWMFLIVEGTVEIIGRNPEGQPVKVCEMNPGEYFGELEFFNNHRCVADVRSVTHVKTAKINRKHFEMCLGPVMHILKRNTANDKYEHYRKLLEREGKTV
eukprot:TRINITY_DN382_c0_g2_i1.p1 TRINITY_DN382_c0_g2~~TRINITY_DN382_c0_g2_i1.p1  ORF type:complete len:526 (+),score=218.21 TRINITY_DN382_c0_g2_i1:98-1579(+)